MEHIFLFEGIVYEAVKLNKHEYVWPINDMPQILRYLYMGNRIVLGGYIYNKKFKRLNYRWIYPLKSHADFSFNVKKSYERAVLYLKQFTESGCNNFYVWIEDADRPDYDVKLARLK